jgi:eukaryotic-like serine/threonine-protein kinase
MSETTELSSDIASVAGGGLLSSGELWAGDSVGPYRLIRLLGQGASGRVFEVEHARLGRRAAMKLVVCSEAARPAARARLFKEALSISRINNAHIVEVTDVVETIQHLALVMELLEGGSLAELMSIGPSAPLATEASGPTPNGGALVPERFLPILAQVCEALAAAHAAGFIHRDLKPENVFLCQAADGSDFVKLLDFGLATSIDARRPASKGLAASEGRRGGSFARSFVGSPAYVSPEQATGAAVTPTTDIYAVGVILFELLCGRLPFEGWSLGEFLIQHLSAPVPRLPETIRATSLGRTLDVIVQRCMDKRPSARFSSAAELAGIFAALARGETVSVARTVAARPRHRLALGLGVVAALAAAVGLAGLPGHHSPRVSGMPALPTAAADLVTIAVESEPAGAEARLAGSGELLGLTPFRRAFPRKNQDLLVELKHTGFEPVSVVVSIASDRIVNATLAPKNGSRRAAPIRTARPRRLGAEKTIDPFRR